MSLDRKGMNGYMDNAQNCPLCGMTHPVTVLGIVRDKKCARKQVPDRGYSFCNCANIWFTDWANIDQDCYDAEYEKRFSSPIVSKAIALYSKYFPMLENVNSFLEIGCINEALLDKAKEEGWATYALDINENVKGNHTRVTCDVESRGSLKSFPRVDVIWASHIFEHFKDPLMVAFNLRHKLSDNGYLFVAMPDPWFINFTKPHEWDHWVLREHHILWDMDSFIDKMIEIGYDLVMSKRNCLSDGICNRDYHILFKKRGYNEQDNS